MSGAGGPGGPRRCDYCGSWSHAIVRTYHWRKALWLNRCPDCDRATFDAQMAVVLVVLVLAAALVCGWLGVWNYGTWTPVIQSGFER